MLLGYVPGVLLLLLVRHLRLHLLRLRRLIVALLRVVAGDRGDTGVGAVDGIGRAGGERGEGLARVGV